MRHGWTVGAVAAVASAALMLALQPVRSSWWNFADPDGAYVGSSLNILVGNHTNYLDHPGLPTQDALALAFGAKHLVGRADETRMDFVNATMLDLDGARWLYRGWAILLFLGSALLVYVVVARLLAHWTWGVAGSLLFVATPGLGGLSFTLRPDPALAALCLAVGYLIVTGFEERSALRYGGAAAVLGLAITVKLTAIGMLVPLAAAAIIRPPGQGWFEQTGPPIGAWMRRNVRWLLPTTLVWLFLCWLFNRERLPIVQTDDQRMILVTGATFLATYIAFAYATERFRIPWADRIFRLSYAWIMLALVAGLALPATLVLDDGVQMLVAIRESLRGQRVNEGIEPFENVNVSTFRTWPLNLMVAIVALGLASGVVGLVRRRYWPPILALGTAVLALMAAARYSYDYYYAPAFAVAIPGALWLVRRRDRAAAPVLVLAVVAAVYVFALTKVQTWQPPREAEINASAQKLADELLEPGDVIVVSNYYLPIEDVRFGSLVDGFVDHVPEYPYRFVTQLRIASERGLTPAYVIGGEELPGTAGETASMNLDGRGPFVVEGTGRAWGPEEEFRVARIVEAPPLES